MIKIKTIEIAALGISLSATGFVALFELALYESFTYLVISLVITFIVVFFVSRYFIRKFVIFKIKPIYQIMMAKNIPTNELTVELSGKEDFVQEIRDELTDWADKKAQEISRLKENERYRKEFLGNVSHEIKTPIFTIQGYILTLLDGGLEDAEINRLYLERTEKSIDRLIHIVNDLDEISKLESGVITLEKTDFDIKALARDIADAMELNAAKRSISIRLETNGNAPMLVYADRSRISQVLVNLMTNSVKYGKEGGTTRVKFIDMFDKVMIEIQDDGIGIDKEHLPRIFERFYRVDKSRSREQGGTGLGLAIVKHIIEAHQERITLRSEIGVGTTFSFSLTKAKTMGVK